MDLMARKPSSIVRLVEEPANVSYQCPGCGEMVDSRQIAEVLAHHQHVLRPTAPVRWFQQAVEAARFTPPPQRSASETGANHERAAASTDMRWRRYGHEQHTSGST